MSEPIPTREEIEALATEAGGWVEGTALSDDANRKIWLLNRCSTALLALSRQVEDGGEWRTKLAEQCGKTLRAEAERDAAYAKGAEAMRERILNMYDPDLSVEANLDLIRHVI